MNSVSINNTDLSTLGLVLPSYEIPTPQPYLYLQAVEGRDGLVDLSNAFGRVFYKNRDWDLDFKITNPSVNWHTIATQVNSLCHGKRFNFKFDNDPDYYWIGRISNRAYSSNQGEGTLPISISSQPYKYKNSVTTLTKTVSGETSITIPNADMWVCPTMTVTSEMSITFNGITDPAASGIIGVGVIGRMVIGSNGYTTATITGTAKIPQFLIPQGGTTVTVTGNGSITFTYQEGLL